LIVHWRRNSRVPRRGVRTVGELVALAHIPSKGGAPATASVLANEAQVD
jgi:hypothetical protein